MFHPWHVYSKLPGKEQGYITYDEILAVIPQPEQTLDQLERLFGALIAAGHPLWR
jgi:hypothetical protein